MARATRAHPLPVRPEGDALMSNGNIWCCGSCGVSGDKKKDDLVRCQHCNVCVHVKTDCYGLKPKARMPREWKCQACNMGIQINTCNLCKRAWQWPSGGSPTLPALMSTSAEGKSWAHVICIKATKSKAKAGIFNGFITGLDVASKAVQNTDANCSHCLEKKGLKLACIGDNNCRAVSHPSCALTHGEIDGADSGEPEYCCKGCATDECTEFSDDNVEMVTKDEVVETEGEEQQDVEEVEEQQDVRKVEEEEEEEDPRVAEEEASDVEVSDDGSEYSDESSTASAAASSTDDDEDEDECQCGTDDGSDRSDEDGDDIDSAAKMQSMTINSSVQLRMPRPGVAFQKKHEAFGSGRGGKSVVFLEKMARDVDIAVADVIGESNKNLLEQIAQYVRLAPGERSMREIQTAVVTTGANLADHGLLFSHLSKHLVDHADAQVARITPYDSCASVRDMLWHAVDVMQGASPTRASSTGNASVTAAQLRSRAHQRPELQQQEIAIHTASSAFTQSTSTRIVRSSNVFPDDILARAAETRSVVIILDSAESVPQAMLNTFIERLVNIALHVKCHDHAITLVLGVTTSDRVLMELLYDRTIHFMCMTPFLVEPAERSIYTLVDALVPKCPIQLGPHVIDFLLRRFNAADKSLRGFAQGFRFALWRHLYAHPVNAELWNAFVCDHSDPPPRRGRSVIDTRRVAQETADYLPTFWHNILLLIKFADRLPMVRPVTVDLYRDLFAGGDDIKRASMSSDGPALQLFWKAIRSIDDRTVLHSVLSSAVNVFEEVESVATSFRNLADQLDAATPATFQVGARKSTKSSKQSSRMMSASSDTFFKTSLLEHYSGEAIKLLRGYICKHLAPITQKDYHEFFFFDDVAALELMFPGDREQHILTMLRQPVKKGSLGADTMAVFQLIQESQSITVDIGALYTSFDVMQPPACPRNEVQVRFLQGIEDLCVLGIVTHSKRYGCIDRIVSSHL